MMCCHIEHYIISENFIFHFGLQAQEEAGYVSLFIQEGHTGVPGSIQRVLDVYKNEVRLVIFSSRLVPFICSIVHLLLSLKCSIDSVY